MIVILKPRWPGIFRRNVRDEAGEVIERLEFHPHKPVELTDEQFEAVRGDIGNALMIVNDKGKPDKKETADIVNGDDGEVEEITQVADSLIPEALQKKLIDAGIKELADLAELIDSSPKWYEDIKGIGEPSANEIVQALKQHEAG